jgi:hypothetical protein
MPAFIFAGFVLLHLIWIAQSARALWGLVTHGVIPFGTFISGAPGLALLYAGTGAALFRGGHAKQLLLVAAIALCAAIPTAHFGQFSWSAQIIVGAVLAGMAVLMLRGPERRDSV